MPYYSNIKITCITNKYFSPIFLSINVSSADSWHKRQKILRLNYSKTTEHWFHFPLTVFFQNNIDFFPTQFPIHCITSRMLIIFLKSYSPDMTLQQQKNIESQPSNHIHRLFTFSDNNLLLFLSPEKIDLKSMTHNTESVVLYTQEIVQVIYFNRWSNYIRKSTQITCTAGSNMWGVKLHTNPAAMWTMLIWNLFPSSLNHIRWKLPLKTTPLSPNSPLSRENQTKYVH